MNEIRRIKADEAEAFLQALCDVFSLDFDRALPLFTTDPLFELDRKWAYFEGGRIVSILTTTPLEFGWGNAIGIAGVATIESRRNEGIARKLIEKVLRTAERDGEGPAMLFATETKLYESLGFEALDQVIRAPVVTLPIEVPLVPIDFDAMRVRYDSWALESPDRMRRDERRWRYWLWTPRKAFAYGDGYFVVENGMIREILGAAAERLPVDRGTEWFGLSFVTDASRVPVAMPTSALVLMGRNVPGQPEMFMTDQF